MTKPDLSFKSKPGLICTNQCENHINQMKNKHLMILKISAEITLDQPLHLFMRKTLNDLGVDGNSLTQ